MLIRTRRGECKAKVALVVRIILFFGIPAAYFVFTYSAVAVAGHANNIGDSKRLYTGKNKSESRSTQTENYHYFFSGTFGTILFFFSLFFSKYQSLL